MKMHKAYGKENQMFIFSLIWICQQMSLPLPMLSSFSYLLSEKLQVEDLEPCLVLSKFSINVTYQLICNWKVMLMSKMTPLFRSMLVGIVGAITCVIVTLNEVWKSITFQSDWMTYFKYHLFGRQETCRYSNGAQALKLHNSFTGDTFYQHRMKLD